ncbi:flagellar basal body P-ring formation chaperone FlgA [Aestuariibacter salexigens]|uniref:flagellar basal body P-ring formation chaperone FlgA n=1 Tax=Aestuariibacter salexigens TaxID=226010 RepID=UPI00047DD330|nr:flagellar basal body P-ring formation chaperone FlgA [Aestuariibacter salexigens]
MKSLTSKLLTRQILNALCAITSLTVVPVSAFASTTQAQKLDHQALQQQVEQYISDAIIRDSGETVAVDVSPIDERIDIPDCPAGVELTPMTELSTQSNISVRADCLSSDWYLFIPVRITRTQQVVIIADVLSPGAILTADNLQLADIDKRQLRTSTFDDVSSLIGARIKRRVRPGQALSPAMLCFVCKGDSVVISAETGGLNIKTSGVAEQDGNLGETIRVRNLRSNKLVHAKVASSGEVSVNI